MVGATGFERCGNASAVEEGTPSAFHRGLCPLLAGLVPRPCHPRSCGPQLPQTVKCDHLLYSGEMLSPDTPAAAGSNPDVQCQQIKVLAPYGTNTFMVGATGFEPAAF